MNAPPSPFSSLAARGIGRRRPNGDGWLLRDVTLTVEPGDRLAIVGPTGAGKSLLLRALALLDAVDEGSVAWNGSGVESDHAADFPPALRSRVIYLAQRPALFAGDVELNLRYPYTLRAHSDASFDRDGAVASLDGLGLDASFLERDTSELSGGEAQIVSLLRATQLAPSILLLDEPTASLDVDSTVQVEQLVASWLTERVDARAAVWVTHHAEQARRVTDRRVGMRAGRIESESESPGPLA